MRKLCYVILAFIVVDQYVVAQSVADCSGGFFTSSNYSFAFSVGEVTTSTLTDTKRLIFATSGVIQPDRREGTKTSDQTENPYTILPNPVWQYVKFYPIVPFDCEYRIFAVNGFQISAGKLLNNQVDVNLLNTGYYLLELSCKDFAKEEWFAFVKM